MLLDKIKYNNKKPYVERVFINRGKNTIGKEYGIIRQCKLCSKNFFVTNSVVKKGIGYFCSLLCKNKKENNPNWKGGRKNLYGYILLRLPTHPSNVGGYVFEHRVIIEKQIGRYLHRWEVVHHINKKKDDNSLENLMLFANDKAHRKYTAIQEGIKPNEIIFDGKCLTKIH